ncbi:MAG: sugar phosphate isomerase/epimerase [Chloroflexi bacterium]|nr:sugar phosphate isomerase/epimerase [Chloroflexota bacterium]
MFQLSACLWSLNGPAVESIRRCRRSGFDFVDLRPDCWSGVEDRAHLEILGVRVPCAGITPVPMASGLSINTLGTGDALAALPYYFGALERASRLGAQSAYMVTPSARVADTAFYRTSMARLAERAASLGVRLCVEPSPGRALGTSAEALQFARSLGAPNLYVLIDLGHTLMTGEDPAEAARQAGDRLGYVHIDDNDGRSDLHLPIFEGVLKPRAIDGFLRALEECGYDRAIGIEMKNSLPGPMAAMVSARDYVSAWSRRKAEALLR